MRHGLFSQDDISKRVPLNPTVIWILRVYAPELMAECITHLEKTAS
jgi:hypothetical protein